MNEYTITFEAVDTPVRYHPTIAAFCRRKRKRWLKRLSKMGLKTFVTTKQVITESE